MTCIYLLELRSRLLVYITIMFQLPKNSNLCFNSVPKMMERTTKVIFWPCLLFMFNITDECAYVTQSDKKGLIAGKYMCSLNNMYLKFSIRYYNSVTFIKLSINFYISGKDFK